MKTLNILALGSLMALVACVADGSEDLELDGMDDTSKVNYYGDVVTMSDLDGMEVHCIADIRGTLDCFDTVDERDVLLTKSGWCQFFEHAGASGRGD